MVDDVTSLSQRVAALEDALRRLLGSNAPGADTATVSPDEWQALGGKLDKLEGTLSGKEKAVLMSILGAAAATYERAGNQEAPATAQTRIALNGALDKVKLSDGLLSIGQFQRPGAGGFGGPVSDSVNVGGDFTSVHGDWSKDTNKLNDAMVRGRWNALAQTPGGLVGNGAPNVGNAGNFGRSGGGGFN